MPNFDHLDFNNSSSAGVRFYFNEALMRLFYAIPYIYYISKYKA